MKNKKKLTELENHPLNITEEVIPNLRKNVELLKRNEKQMRPKDPNHFEAMNHAPFKHLTEKLDKDMKDLEKFCAYLRKIKSH